MTDNIADQVQAQFEQKCLAAVKAKTGEVIVFADFCENAVSYEFLNGWCEIVYKGELLLRISPVQYQTVIRDGVTQIEFTRKYERLK